MDTPNKEFVVKEISRYNFEVRLVEKITGRLIEKFGLFGTEEEAEKRADELQGQVK